MPDDPVVDKYPHLKQLMRRFTTRHRLGPDEIETEEEMSDRRKKRSRTGVGYRQGHNTSLLQEFGQQRSRMERYADYRDMGEDSAISSGLDIYADEASQEDPLDGHVLKVEGEDEEVVEEVEKFLFDIVKVDEISWDRVRRLCQFGDVFTEIKFRKDFKGIHDVVVLDHNRMDRLEEQRKLLGFRERAYAMTPKAGMFNGDPSGNSPYSKAMQPNPEKKDQYFSPFRIVHWRLPDATDSIYGRSVLHAVRRTWRQVRLMEDSIVIYRISRGAERRVFYINVGNLADDEAEGYMRNLMAKFRKKPFVNPRTNEVDEKANPLAWDEDFYIPIQSDKDNSRIEQLPGGQNMSEIEDLQYFRAKIDQELKIPTSYLNRDGQFDSKAGLSQQDIRFSRTIERIQRAYVEGIQKIVYIHLMLKSYTYGQITSFTIKMTPPSALAELLKLDALSMKLEIAGNAKSIELLPDIYILTEIMGFSEDEANELMQIMQQQRLNQMQAEAAAGGAEGGLGGGGGAPPAGGGEGLGGEEGGVAGELPGGEAGGEGGAAGEEGGVGTPELAHVTSKQPVINEARMHHLVETYIQRRKDRKAARRARIRRTTTFEHLLSHGELAGMQINLGHATITEGDEQESRVIPLNEALTSTLSQATALLESKEERERRVRAEVDRLIAEEATS